MFKRKKKFKPYRMKPIRVKPWWEKAGIQVMLFLGLVGSLLAWMADAIFSAIDSCASYTSGAHSEHDIDWFEFGSGTSSNLFSQDDDDITRGHWDVTSIYYSMFHTDD